MLVDTPAASNSMIALSGGTGLSTAWNATGSLISSGAATHEFWLGTHRPNWLGLTDVPLMVSHGTLRLRKSLPRALGEWVLDSRGFSELKDNGRWTIPARTYAEAARRYMQEVGRLRWAAIQDWMCEPFILAKTGLTVEEHQARTIDSWFELNDLAPDVPWIPILQGWSARDYLRHVGQWTRRGVDLARAAIVGVGSVCRRQGTREGVDIFKALSWLGLKLHGFGVKIGGLRMARRYLKSSDSMAWSYAARQNPPCLTGHTHKNGANCLGYALEWRARVA